MEIDGRGPFAPGDSAAVMGGLSEYAYSGLGVFDGWVSFSVVCCVE